RIRTARKISHFPFDAGPSPVEAFREAAFPPSATTTMMPSAIHASTPEHIGQDDETNRPEKNETQDHRDNPSRPAEIVESLNHLRHRHPLLGLGCKCILHSHRWASRGSVQGAGHPPP